MHMKKETDRLSLGWWRQHPHQNCPWPRPPPTANKNKNTSLNIWILQKHSRRAINWSIWCGLYLLQGGGLHGCRALSEGGGRTGARGGGKLLPIRAAGLVWARLHICLWEKRRLLINVWHSVSKDTKKHKWQISDRIPHHVTEQHHTWFIHNTN